MNEIVPVGQQTVVFYEDEITAVIALDGGERVVYVPLRPICDFLGLVWSGQFERLQRDPVLSQLVRGVRVTRTPAEGGEQEMTCLPLEYLNGWVFRVNANRVTDNIREKVIRYQLECYRGLASHFITNPASSPTNTLAQVEAMGLAIATMAREQMEFERRLDKTEIVSQAAAVTVVQLLERVDVLEARTGAGEFITEGQASDISQSVKALAIALAKKDGSTKYENRFGFVYGEMYRRYRIGSYRRLRQEHYEDVMTWLNQWYQSI